MSSRAANSDGRLTGERPLRSDEAMPRSLAAALIAVVLTAGLEGCGDGDDGSPRPTPTPGPSIGSAPASAFAGTYDAAVSGDLGDQADLVGGAFSDGSNFLGLSLRSSSRHFFSLQGFLTEAGTFDLTGVVGTPRRAIFVEGRGIATHDRSTEKIVGTAHSSNSFLDFELSFTFDRPHGADPTSFMGVHRFDFTPSPSACGCDSTATFAITPLVNGAGLIYDAVPELDAAGHEVGAFSGGECLVSPTGRVSCEMAYGPTQSSAWFPAAHLFGRFARAGEPAGTGLAEFFREGDDTAREATWTATRIGPFPEPTATTSP